MQDQQYSVKKVRPPPRNAPAGASVEKPEREAANVEVLPHVDADVRGA